MNRLIDRTCLIALSGILLVLVAVNVAQANPAPGDCTPTCQHVIAGVPCGAGVPGMNAFLYTEETCQPCDPLNIGNCRFSETNTDLCFWTSIDIGVSLTPNFLNCGCNDGNGTNYNYAEAWNLGPVIAPAQTKLKTCSVRDSDGPPVGGG